MSVSGEDRPSSSNYRGDTDEESYKPDISDASSVILLICGCGALLSSIFVALSIRRYGTNSASSKLVFMINCAQGMAIFSKLPFVFNNISYGCTISQIILLYAFTQLWLVSYMMLLCTNHLKLDLQSTVYSSSELGLNKKYELFLYISPFFASILPITADAFEEKYNWCVTNPNVHNGSWMLAQAVLFMLIIFSFMGRQVWVIYKRAQECAAVIPPKKIIERIMKGPFVYAIVTIIFGFVGVILIRGSDNLEDDTTKKAYYVSYAIVYLFFVPGYINFFLFFVERRHLKVKFNQLFVFNN